MKVKPVYLNKAPAKCDACPEPCEVTIVNYPNLSVSHLCAVHYLVVCTAVYDDVVMRRPQLAAQVREMRRRAEQSLWVPSGVIKQ